MDLKTYLAQYDQPQTVQHENTGHAPLDSITDGNYIVKVTQMMVRKSKTKGLPQLVWKMKITEGTYKEGILWKVNGLDTMDKISYLKRDLALAGLSLQRMANLEKEVLQLVDQHLRVAVKIKGTWKNVYIQKPVTHSLYQNSHSYPF